jgi:hypothetical protein
MSPMRRWAGNSRRLLPLASLVALAGLFGLAAPGPARAQTTELPCDMTADRTVDPTTVAVEGKVHVTINVRGTCSGGAKGVDIFFVVDRSVTMFDKKYLDPTKDALTRFVNLMNFQNSTGGLITFAAQDDVRSNLTKDRDALIQAIKAIRLSQETDVRGLQGAIRTATQKLDDNGTPGNDKVIMVLVAGPDTSQALINMPTVTQAARNAGMKVIFLMFPESRYVHYVEASTDCVGTFCGRWQGPRGAALTKWAWGVDLPGTAEDVGERLKTLAELLLKAPTLKSVEVYDGLSGFFEWVPGSAVPEPTTTGGGADLTWNFDSVPPEGITIEYDVTALEEGRFKTAVVSRVAVTLSTNETTTVGLPNPEITVVDPSMITPSATPVTPTTATTPPTPTTPSPTHTSEPTVATPTPSATPFDPTPTATTHLDRAPVYLPWVNK